MKLIDEIRAYVPVNPQEARDKALIMQFLEGGQDVFHRENLAAHMTASAWVVSPDRKHVLMAYHNLYDSWAWMGGHADGEQDLLAVALRETREESGLEEATPVSREIFSLEILPVSGHEKRGVYVPSHLHLNVTYLLQADPSAFVRCKPDENSAVAWFPVEVLPEKISEPWMLQRIYRKLLAKATTI